MKRDNYIVIKELIDASVGTLVVWDEYANAYFYKKNVWVSPCEKNYLTAGQVTQSSEYFCKEDEYAESYAYNNPVFSRKDITDMISECFPDRRISGDFSISVASELNRLHAKLRTLAKTNAEKILNKHGRNN